MVVRFVSPEVWPMIWLSGKKERREEMILFTFVMLSALVPPDEIWNTSCARTKERKESLKNVAMSLLVTEKYNERFAVEDSLLEGPRGPGMRGFWFSSCHATYQYFWPAALTDSTLPIVKP